MILDIVEGDILKKTNKADVIIGMNSELGEVYGIGLPFTWQIQHNKPLKLGTVFSFELDKTRNLHMIICHHLYKGGWLDADKYIRFGMDFLWQSDAATREFSVVKIGTGRVGKRDGADVPKIINAISSSQLPMKLFIHRPPERVAVEAHQSVVRPPLVAFRSWSREEGVTTLAA